MSFMSNQTIDFIGFGEFERFQFLAEILHQDKAGIWHVDQLPGGKFFHLNHTCPESGIGLFNYWIQA